MAAGASEGSPIQWTTPAGWEQQAASQMRVGSFVINKDGQHAEVSIIPLGGMAGGELANVNRWRGQVGLPPVDESQLAATGEKVSIGSTPASLYDVAGTNPQTQQAERILGSILTSEGTTWFFKMTGSDALVESEKPAFKEFLKSIRMGGAPQAAPMAEASRPLSTNIKEVPVGPGDGEKPSWQVPAGWQEQAPTAMRLASFKVSGENGAKADVSVIKLGGIAGGMLANVNRWRGQIGLSPVDQAGLDKLVTTQNVNGSAVSLVDMSGQSTESGNKERLLAAVVPRGDSTWFYKMLGDPNLVEQQKPAFVQFVESARYSNAP
jgi:hypothetical protein